MKKTIKVTLGTLALILPINQALAEIPSAVQSDLQLAVEASANDVAVLQQAIVVAINQGADITEVSKFVASLSVGIAIQNGEDTALATRVAVEAAVRAAEITETSAIDAANAAAAAAIDTASKAGVNTAPIETAAKEGAANANAGIEAEALEDIGTEEDTNPDGEETPDEPAEPTDPGPPPPLPDFPDVEDIISPVSD